MQTNITKQNETEITIEVSINASDFVKERIPALKTLGKNVELKGFRRGHVPDDVLATHIGEGQLLQEMANRAINAALPNIIDEHKLRPTLLPGSGARLR